ncbi:hypothetical protein COB64_02100 [Candidatus Wolfebacteria bacterium]|nr:MAG: hypothetical protein COB64_02100 [Candidatus Wolfebacteria bacterium]
MEIDTHKYKDALENEKALLLKELANLGIRDPENNDWGAIPNAISSADIADKNTLADRDEEFGEKAGILGELEIRYNNIKDALKRMEDGTYGICEKGGEQIEADRLDANPAARTCKNHIND